MEILAVDFLITAVLLVSAALSLMRGFTKEVLSIAGWLAAGYAAIFLSPLVKPLLAQYMSADWMVNTAAMLLVFLAVLIAFSIAAGILASALKSSSIGALDRSLGVVFGLLRGAFIVCLAYFVVVLIIPEDEHPDWLAKAKLRPLLQTGTRAMVAIVPIDRLPVNISNIEGLVRPEMRDRIIDEVSGEVLRKVVEDNLENLIPDTNGASEKEKQDSTPDTGYKRLERDQMERLIRNTEGVK